MTFNPGAIPVAVAMLVFAFIIGTRRERLLDRYDRKRRKTRSLASSKFMMGYATFMVVVAVLLAGAALFIDFDR